MFDAILLPTDGSEAAHAAVRHARSLAETFEATVHVLHVQDADAAANGTDSTDAARESVIEPVRADIDLSDVEVVTALESGTAHEAILEYAQSEAIDLVAMGTHGRSGLKRYVLGSVAERVLRLADRPVLLVPPQSVGTETRCPYERLLFPTDGSEAAQTVLPELTSLAAAYEARVDILSVIDTASVGPDVRSTALTSEIETAHEQAVADAAAHVAGNAVGSVTTVVERGSPHEVIADYAEANGVDMIVLSTHGRRGIQRYLLGSVTENVVRTSPAPVLAVGTKDD